MKNTLLLLACATVSGLTLSSCVVDPYGYPVAGGAIPAARYSSVNYYDSDPYDGGYGYGSGYSPFYSPVSTSFSFFGGSGWDGNNCNRPSYYSSGHHHSSSRSSYRAPVSSSHHYASQVTRPSTFRGSSVFSSPAPTPSLPSPRTLSRPSIQRSAPFSAPSRSFSAPSLPSPSGRAERSSPGVASFAAPSSSRSALSSISSDSGRFGGVPSDRRRER